MILQSVSELSYIPQRIVSLVPSQTELLHYLALEKETVGITKFCVHPAAWFRSKTKVGGTKQININLVKQLHPDLIIGNKEENVREQVEELAKDYPVWVTDVNTVEDGLSMINDIGILTGKMDVSLQLIDTILTGFKQLKTQDPEPKTCYLIWENPYMTVGGDTFINDMLLHCGFKNAFATGKRYPDVTMEQLQEMQPGVVMLSSEPYPFKEKHVAALQQQLPDTKILLVNGEMFSWYGSRMLLMPTYLNELMSRVNDE